LALPFFGEVYEHDIHRTTPLEANKAWEEAFLNSQIKFESQRKSPHRMWAIIKNDQIIFTIGNTDNR
jgi:hypothetical protein